VQGPPGTSWRERLRAALAVAQAAYLGAGAARAGAA